MKIIIQKVEKVSKWQYLYDFSCAYGNIKAFSYSKFEINQSYFVDMIHTGKIDECIDFSLQDGKEYSIKCDSDGNCLVKAFFSTFADDEEETFGLSFKSRDKLYLRSNRSFLDKIFKHLGEYVQIKINPISIIRRRWQESKPNEFKISFSAQEMKTLFGTFVMISSVPFDNREKMNCDLHKAREIAIYDKYLRNMVSNILDLDYFNEVYSKNNNENNSQYEMQLSLLELRHIYDGLKIMTMECSLEVHDVTIVTGIKAEKFSELFQKISNFLKKHKIVFPNIS